MSSQEHYGAEQITILKGLEPVRLRPGMYIGSTNREGLHHLVWEIVDNSVDEAINGHCTTIEVKLHKDGSIEVSDNGRGVPIDIHPETGLSALEVIFTTLHAGGKFDESNYKVSGGLHGVGSSVVCALSEHLEVTSYRDGAAWQQSFSKGKALTKLQRVRNSNKHGTTVLFKPDPSIFPDTAFSFDKIEDFLTTKSFLNAGLQVSLSSPEKNVQLCYPQGIVDYVNELVRKKKYNPLNEQLFHFRHEDEKFTLELALYWLGSSEGGLYSYANAIRTVDGGTHENGVKNGVSRAVRSYIETHGLAPKNITVTAEDCRHSMLGMVSVFLKGTAEFQGQTKNRLNSDISGAVEQKVRNELEHFLNTHSSIGKQIAEHTLTVAKARIASREAKNSVLRKKLTGNRLNLPGKLSDCGSKSQEESELFICEGDSAGGSSKQARDRKTQAILPIRGKILNVEGTPFSKVEQNQEIQNIISALGCGIGDNLDLNRLRYGKVIIMTDADADGAHISILLLTFFYRYMQPLIEKGHLYIALPPLYRIDTKDKTFYAKDDAQKDTITGKIKGKYEISRFKGLGEMPPADLKKTTMDKKTRSILQVKVGDFSSSDDLFMKLMGNEAKHRYDYICEHSNLVGELLDI